MLIGKFLALQNQIRVLHWQTESYAEHKALGKAYESLDELVDSFVETYFGAHGRHSGASKLEVVDYGEATPVAVMEDGIKFLKEEIEEYLDDSDTDLMNIRDDMLGTLNHTKYLLSLK